MLAKLCKPGLVFLDGQIQRRVPFFPKRVLQAIQSRRVSNIVRHACQTVPFYRQAMEERGLRPDDSRTASEIAHLPLSQSIQLADGRSITSGVFLGNFRNQLSTVRKAQATSAGLGRIRWRIVPGRGDDPAIIEQQVLVRCREVFGAALQATVEFVDDIPTPPSGKYEAVVHDASHGSLP